MGQDKISFYGSGTGQEWKSTPVSSSSLEVLDFHTINNTFKIKWIIEFLKSPDSIWNAFPSYLFNTLGGIHFLLKCNFSIDKIPLKLADFHKQALLSWILIYKHNFSPHRYFIWNNKEILYNKKSLFCRPWFDRGILLVGQLLNKDGFLMSYSEFLQNFNFSDTKRIRSCIWCNPYRFASNSKTHIIHRY